MSMSACLQTSNAQGIREYLRRRYFEAARRRHETLVTLRAGDIHRELGLKNRVPNVCQVMESKVLEKECGVKIISRQGPPSGRGTTLTVTYQVETEDGNHAGLNNQVDWDATKATRQTYPRQAHPSPPQPRQPHPGIELFLALRGSGSAIFKELGGGESFIQGARTNFYSADKKELL